jgi:hypothetical protein
VTERRTMVDVLSDGRHRWVLLVFNLGVFRTIPRRGPSELAFRGHFPGGPLGTPGVFVIILAIPRFGTIANYSKLTDIAHVNLDYSFCRFSCGFMLNVIGAKIADKATRIINHDKQVVGQRL